DGGRPLLPRRLRQTSLAPQLAQAPVSPEQAAADIVDEVLAGTRYIITHGDLGAAVRERSALLQDAAQRALSRTSAAESTRH
ncbi:hypothetical protein, partial [Nocardia sp.]|uniref:hypothetical protein n=1 Tax=Nocardia sp. TaxID=1821 RepID=UPI00258974C8